MKSTTVRLDAELDPLTIGAENGLLWSREGFTIAGIGEALRMIQHDEADVMTEIEAGKLHAKKIGSAYRVTRASLDAFLAG